MQDFFSYCAIYSLLKNKIDIKLRQLKNKIIGNFFKEKFACFGGIDPNPSPFQFTSLVSYDELVVF